MLFELPVGTNPRSLEFPYFPTRLQAVVWRNWELVPVERIALVLETNEENILELAQGMGLRILPIICGQWLKRGYVTIIRVNWHLLPYKQLLTILDWTAEKLAYTLKEDDFLWLKMGYLKPDVEPVIFAPLSEEEKLRTEEVRCLVQKHFPDIAEEDATRPFDFLKKFEKPEMPMRRVFGSTEHGEVLLNDSWKILYTPIQTNPVNAFIQRFISDHENRWGYKLSTSAEPVNAPSIILDVQADSSLLRESHTIKITPDCIRITAVDEVGLLRGLQWMEKVMEQRGGPYIGTGKIIRKTRFDIRIIYSYFAVYGDPLLEPEINPYPDELLLQLSKLGINGIWLQGVLYSLVPWDDALELSENWKKRIEGLKRLVDRAANFGIGVYLYLNEPRAMPFNFFEKHPEWKGFTDGELASLCTSHRPVQEYLCNGVARLFNEVPGLSGVITITMSENVTNCYSRAPQGKTNCPHCAERLPQEVVAEVNRLIAEGAHSVKPDARIICWNWGWNEMWGWDSQMARDAVSFLPDNVSVMCTSEDGILTKIGGVQGSVLDYSISVAGPSEKSIESWEYASKRGLKTVAKVQFNNSWECSAVPYLPVMDLVEQHIRNLINTRVNGLMLGWTLGGYPSLTLELASQYYWEQEGFGFLDSLDLARREFGEKAGIKIKEAWSIFSEAFKEFPFHLDVLYSAPQNYGPMNLLYEKPTGYSATMLGFPYDDVESWRGIYPADIFEEQFKKLSDGWKHGLDIIKEVEKEIDTQRLNAYIELKNIAASTYCHFRSTYLQIAFVGLRDSLFQEEDTEKREEIKCNIIHIIDEEIEIAKKLYYIVIKDSRIGFEASNHYYYTKQDLMEKVINCEYLCKRFLLG